ncbi:acyl-CoA-binding protein [Helicostylum pulchrum]|uniref:ACB domain-containing protein n=1 Tax=Helicostylum pulchrum TaxID=562976 RepID=A0ABP9XRG1_9FUNG|nr:acyl-CoA-binding protein [Helicostylum pulchrum]
MDEICQDDQWFEQAFTYMNKHDIPLPNDKKLHFYGLFKQATIGDCNIEKPGLFEFVGRAKYDAWNSFKGLGFREARNLYIESVEELKVGWSRQGEYEYIPSPEEIKKGDGLSNNAVSSMAVEEGENCESDDIFGYARQDNLEKLSLAITQDNELLNSKDQDGFTVLHLASDRGNIDIVKYLIDAGADLNIQTDEDKETALHLACISEQFEIAKLLIDRGIDQTLVDAEGKTAFEQADESFVNKLVVQN